MQTLQTLQEGSLEVVVKNIEEMLDLGFEMVVKGRKKKPTPPPLQKLAPSESKVDMVDYRTPKNKSVMARMMIQLLNKSKGAGEELILPSIINQNDEILHQQAPNLNPE